MKVLKLVYSLLLVCSFNSLLAQDQSFTLWYEYGDSRFLQTTFVNEDSMLAYIQLLPTEVGPRNGYQRVHRHYTPKPPTAMIVNGFSKRSNVIGWQPNMDQLVLNKDLETVSSTSDFISLDTMQVALHYNKSAYPNATKVGFFYNSNGDASFKSISSVDDRIDIPEESTGENKEINQVRMYNGENGSIANNSILSQVFAPNGNNYQDGIIFNLSPEAGLEGNIFITLFTNENIEIDDDEDFKLVFFDNEGVQLNSSNQNMVNHAKLKSHDPNYEKVKPSCIILSELKDTIGDYDIHFQNTGEGPADSVITYTKLPDGYTVNDIIGWNTATTTGITSWAIGGVNLNANYNVFVSSEQAGNTLVLRFLRKPENPSIVSPTELGRSVSEVLVGTHKLANPLNDKKTMGEFQFQLQLKPIPVAPLDLVSYTNIKFDTNALVRTDDAVIRIRYCCSCRDGNNSNNKPCKSKSKFLRWLFCKDC
jgi:hypothetical protein